MAIKIDLLPRYVALQRRFNMLWKVAAGILLSTILVLALLHARGETELKNLTAQLEKTNAEAELTKTAEEATGQAREAAAPLETYNQFIVNASRTGAERAALIDLVTRYVTPGAVVSSINMSNGTQAVIAATLRSPDDYARFLLGLRSGSASRGGPLFAADPLTSSVVPSNPVVSSQPLGYGAAPVRPAPGAQPQVVTYPIQMTVTGTLKSPVTIPAEPGSGTAASTGAPGGPPSGGPPTGGPPTGGPPSGGPPTGAPSGPPGNRAQ